jgi:hypothetical protein
MNEPQIAVCMLYHTKKQRFESVLKALSNVDYPKSKINLIMIGNNAPPDVQKVVDDWLEPIRSEYASVIHIQAAGRPPHLRNIALKMAMERNLDFLIFNDSDVPFYMDTVRRLLAPHLARPNNNIFIVSISKIHVNESQLTFWDRVRWKYDKTLKHLEPGGGLISSDVADVAACAINLKLVPKAGLFDEDIKFVEDWDWVRRATAMGFLAFTDTTYLLPHYHVWSAKTAILRMLGDEGRAEAKIILKQSRLKLEIRGLTYWCLLSLSIPIILITIWPFLVLLSVGWLTYIRRMKGIGKLIGFPYIAVYRIIRSWGIVLGLIYWTIWMRR